MADAVAPPEGFVLDQPPPSLPEGFVLDSPHRDADSAMQKALTYFKPDEQSPTLVDAIVTGAKKSVFGTIASRGEQEQQQAFNWYQRAASNITSLAADAPFMVLGALGGGAVGSAAGPAGTVVGAGAGSFALPEALRQTMIEGYSKGWFKDFGDFWTRLTAASLQTGKAGALGAVIGPAGAAGKALLPAAASPLAKTGAELAAQVTTMSTLGAAMEGHIPGWQDFLDNAILLGAAKGVMHVAGTTKIAEKLGKTYADTGLTPEQVRAESERNPTIIQDLASDNRPVPEALKPATLGEPLTKEQFYDKYYQHIDLRGGKEGTSETNLKGVQESGFTAAGPGPNLMPAYQGGKPLSIMEQRYAPKQGDTVYLVPEDATIDTPNGRKIKTGWKPEPGEVFVADKDFASTYDGYLAARNKVTETASGEQEIPAQAQAAQSVGERVREAVRAKMGGGGKPPEPPAPPAGGGMEGRSDAEKKILSHIVTEIPKERLTAWEYAQKFYSKYWDENYPVPGLRIGKKEAKSLLTGESKDIGPYIVKRLTAGTAGKAKQFIELGTFDADTYKQVGPSLNAVLKSVTDPAGFEAYISSKHSIERAAVGKPTGFDQEAAHQVVADGATKYEKAAQGLYEYKDALMDYAIKAGIISKESAASMRKAYQSHVSLYKVFESGEAATKDGGTPYKRATGGEEKVFDPLQSAVNDTFFIITLAEKNMAKQELVKLGPEFAEKQNTQMKPIKITDKEVMKALKEQDIDVDAEGFVAFRPQSYNVSPNEVAVFEKGKRSIYKVDPDLALAYHGLDLGPSSLLTGMLRSAAGMLRAGVTLSPDFSPRNLARDAPTAFIYAGSHPLKTVKGAISYFKEDAAYQNWLKGGGANAAIVSLDRRYLEQHLYEMEPETHLMGRAWNVIKSPIEALRIVSETMENVTRLGIARDELMVAKDKAQIQALSMLTREGTVDFARHGSDPFFRQWQLATAFMNPAMQGIDRMVRAFKDNPIGTTAKAFAIITIPSLLLWWKNRDDPRWGDIPDWQRDLFWIAFTNDWQKPENETDLLAHAGRGMAKEVNGETLVNKGLTFRIPKPFEVGVLFGSVPERILDAYVADKPDAFKHFGKTLGNVFGINVIPTALVPPFQQMTNYNFFTDRPLVPDSMKHLLPEYQYSAYTTEATKALGSIIGSVPGMKESSFASPVVIDNYIRGWSGTLGDYAMQISSAALEKAGVLPSQVKPTKSLAEYPIIKAFMIRDPSASAQSIQDFYDHYEKAKTRLDTIKHEAMLGHMDAVMKEMSVNPVELERIESIHKALGQATHVIQFVQANPQITPDEKRQLIDATYSQMIYMTRTGNAALQAIKKTMDAPVLVPKAPTHAPAEMVQ